MDQHTKAGKKKKKPKHSSQSQESKQADMEITSAEGPDELSINAETNTNNSDTHGGDAKHNPEFSDPEQEMSLDYLSNETVIHIMEFLPLKARVQLERVSSRWQRLSKTTWRLERNILLSYFKTETKREGSFSHGFGFGSYHIDINTLRSIVPRFSPFVEKLSFDRCYTTFRDDDQDRDVKLEEVFEIFQQEEAPKLRELCLETLNLTRQATEQFRNAFFQSDATNLESIDFGKSVQSVARDDRIRVGEIVASCFRRCPKLKVLKVERCSLGSECLTAIQDSIERIHLDGMFELEDWSFADEQDDEEGGDEADLWNPCLWTTLFATPKPKLTELSVATVAPANDRVILPPVSQLPALACNLRVLDLSGSLRNKDFTPLKGLPLAELYLNECFVEVLGAAEEAPYYRSRLFQELTDGVSRMRNALKILHLNNNPGLPEDTLKAIGRFPCLEEISLEGSTSATDGVFDSISRCPRLSAVSVGNNDSFSDECLQSLGLYSRQLSYLDVSYCNSITDEGLVTMVSGLVPGVGGRPENAQLTIYARNTSIDEIALQGVQEDQKLLTVITADAECPPKRYKFALDPDMEDDMSDYFDIDDEDHGWYESDFENDGFDDHDGYEYEGFMYPVEDYDLLDVDDDLYP